MVTNKTKNMKSKSIKNVILLASTALFFVACGDKFKEVTQKTSTFSDINTINLNVPGTVLIENSPDFSVLVQTHEDILNNVVVTNTLGQLNISIPEPEKVKFEVFNIVIKTNLLREINNNSSAAVTVGPVMTFSASKINQNGSGNISISGLNSSLSDITLAGSGDLTVAGTSDNVNLYLTGNGNIKGFSLEGNTVIANISGTGNIETKANVALGAIISGNGTIFYKGHPTTDINITGTGSVKDFN